MQRPSDPKVGALLGERYRLLEPIGHGGAGRVYRAIQEPMGRVVAVKIMHAGLDPEGSHDFQARFLREAALAGRIQHPHVVTVHDYGRTPEGECYIAMEHLRGRTLRALLRDGPLPLPRALRIFEQLLRGLRAAHQAGLVHRDVKPSNVILLRADDGGDFVKLFDFGLVKGDEEATITQVGVFMGTPQYVSPEQARGDSSDPRSDLYSAGVILYRMVTGVLPYTADTPIAVAWMHVRDALPPMAERAPGVLVPAAVEALVRRLLEKEPDDRFPDADAALAEISRVRQELGLGEEGAPRVQPRDPEETASLVPQAAEVDAIVQELAERPDPRGWRRMAAGGAVILLGLGGVTAAMLAGRGEGSVQPATPAPVVQAPIEAAAVVAAPVVPEPAPEPVREVVLLISSEPGGAEVWLGDLSLGRTPLARSMAVQPGEGGPRAFRLALEGHREAEVVLDLDLDQAAGHARLERVGGTGRGTPGTATSGAGTAGAGASGAGTAPAVAVVADDVRFSADQAAAALAWLNSADADTLRASGIAARQVNIILDGRPFPDLSTFAATPFVGPKTLERLKEVAAP